MSETKETAVGALRLREYTKGLLHGTDALLLADFVVGGSKKRAFDLCCGSGIVALLLLSGKKCANVTGVEIQEKYARLASENAVINGLSGSFECICGDIREHRSFLKAGCVDIVTVNPPYLPVGSGKGCLAPEKQIARCEVMCTIDDVCRCASFLLRAGGGFFVVYRPDRLTDLLCAMRKHAVEPKRMVPVCPRAGASPSLVLVEGRRCAAPGLRLGPCLDLSSDPGA